MNRKKNVLIVLGFFFFACLLTCGYFGMKAVRRIRQRRAAMAAYENRDYALAERLLLQYVRKNPNAEAEFVTLANIYHEFGNTGMAAQMWQKASALDPLNPECRENMLTSAVKSANYSLLHGILGRKARIEEPFTDQELYLYVISSYRSGYPKDGDDSYRKAVKDDPERFHKSELGQLADFMACYGNLSDGERDAFLTRAMQSEDSAIRFEALYTAIVRAAQRHDEADRSTEERLLKQAAETNRFSGTPLLADFYFSQFRFRDATDILEPYLETIDDASLCLLFAESCVFEGKLDEIRTLEKKLRQKSDSLQLLSDYCEILIAYMENDKEKLALAVRKSGKLIDSPLSRFIRLRVAMSNKSFNEILTVAQEVFSYPPFYDLHDRALFVCLDYIAEEMKKPENRKDPSQMAELAKILSGYLQGNLLLTQINLMDQYRKGLAKEGDLLAALDRFPDDALLRRIAAEYLLLNGKPEKALDIIEQILTDLEDAGEEPDRTVRFLYMLALDRLGRSDEASIVFRTLIEQSEFDLGLLNEYFRFCLDNRRPADLAAMADKLEAMKDGRLEHYGKFFRAAILLPDGDDAAKEEALDLLASTPTGDPEFTLYAANLLYDNDRLDEAEEKYKAILETSPSPSLILVNLSLLYHAKGDERNALETAKKAFELEKKSMVPAFIYARRLSEAGRYEEAVAALKFPRHPVDYDEDVVALWTDCMRRVIEKSVADRKFLQAEEQCKHLLIIAPDDEFGQETMEKVREILFPKKDA